MGGCPRRQLWSSEVGEKVLTLIRERHLASVGNCNFCLRWRSVAAAHVGSCSSSTSRFSRVAEEEEGQGGAAAVLLAGALVVTGAVEVDGDGSKPE